MRTRLLGYGLLCGLLVGCGALPPVPPTPSSTTAPASPTPSSTSAPVSPEQGTVTRVVDGDTVDVDTGGVKPLRVRVLGIDTPEVFGGKECWGPEASAFGKEQLAGQLVSLEIDPKQGDTDRYRRALRYVILPDGSNYSILAVETGNAYYYEQYPVRISPELAAAEQRAQAAGLGLWGPPCLGKTEG